MVTVNVMREQLDSAQVLPQENGGRFSWSLE